MWRPRLASAPNRKFLQLARIVEKLQDEGAPDDEIAEVIRIVIQEELEAAAAMLRPSEN